MRRIVYANPDGGVCVVTPVISMGDPAEMTEDEALARALSKDVPSTAHNITIIEPAAVPSDRSKRYAWRLRGGAIVIDPTVQEPANVRKGRRFEELKSKRRAGSPLAPLEQQEMIDLIAGV